MYSYCTCNRILGVTLMSDINNTNKMTTSLLTIVNADQFDARNSDTSLRLIQSSTNLRALHGMYDDNNSLPER